MVPKAADILLHGLPTAAQREVGHIQQIVERPGQLHLGQVSYEQNEDGMGTSGQGAVEMRDLPVGCAHPLCPYGPL